MNPEVLDLEALRDHLSASLDALKWYDPTTRTLQALRVAQTMAHRACEAAYLRLEQEASNLEEEHLYDRHQLPATTVRWGEPK